VTSRRRARWRRVVLSVVFFKVIFLGLASGVALGRPSSIPAASPLRLRRSGWGPLLREVDLEGFRLAHRGLVFIVFVV
jgi:hypothetical protein